MTHEPREESGPQRSAADVPPRDHAPPAAVFGGAAPAAVDDDVTMLLLSLAARRRVGPFAPLLRRLEQPGGSEWFLGAFDDACRSAQIGMAVLTDAQGGQAGLRRLKSWAKAMLKEAGASDKAPTGTEQESEPMLLGLLAYATTVAIGLAVHGIRLSSRPPREWDPLFVDLAELAPMPWAETFRSAVGR